MASQLDAPIRRFLASLEAAGAAPNTIRLRRYHLTRFASVVDKPPDLVDDDDVEDFLYTTCAGVAPITKAGILASLSAFFNHLHRKGKVAANPCAAVTRPRQKKERPTYYRPEEVARLIQCGELDPRQRVLVCLLARHGQRISSVIGLRWAGVDFDRGRVTYPPAKGGAGLALALDLDTAKRLKAWRALAGESEWVFPGRFGGHLVYHRARNLLIAACKCAGVPYRGAHELRRTCITTLLQNGVPLHRVSRAVAGHASVTTTVKFYAGADDDEDVAAAIRALPY